MGFPGLTTGRIGLTTDGLLNIPAMGLPVRFPSPVPAPGRPNDCRNDDVLCCKLVRVHNFPSNGGFGTHVDPWGWVDFGGMLVVSFAVPTPTRTSFLYNQRPTRACACCATGRSTKADIHLRSSVHPDSARRNAGFKFHVVHGVGIVMETGQLPAMEPYEESIASISLLPIQSQGPCTGFRELPVILDEAAQRQRRMIT